MTLLIKVIRVLVYWLKSSPGAFVSTLALVVLGTTADQSSNAAAVVAIAGAIAVALLHLYQAHKTARHQAVTMATAQVAIAKAQNATPGGLAGILQAVLDKLNGLERALFDVSDQPSSADRCDAPPDTSTEQVEHV